MASTSHSMLIECPNMVVELVHTDMYVIIFDDVVWDSNFLSITDTPSCH